MILVDNNVRNKSNDLEYMISSIFKFFLFFNSKKLENFDP